MFTDLGGVCRQVHVLPLEIHYVRCPAAGSSGRTPPKQPNGDDGPDPVLERDARRLRGEPRGYEAEQSTSFRDLGILTEDYLFVDASTPHGKTQVFPPRGVDPLPR
jgi:hypothetical protein